MIGRRCPVPPGEARWLRPTAESSYVRGFAAPAANCSGSVATATEGTVTAATHAGKKLVASSVATPIADMNGVSAKQGLSIIAPASATIASA